MNKQDDSVKPERKETEKGMTQMRLLSNGSLVNPETQYSPVSSSCLFDSKLLNHKYPIFFSFLSNIGVTSPLSTYEEEGRAVRQINGSWVKLFSLRSMVRNQSSQLPLLNEYSVANWASTLSLTHLMPLSGVFRGWDHIGLRYPEYEMDLTEYLELHRDPTQLPALLL